MSKPPMPWHPCEECQKPIPARRKLCTTCGIKRMDDRQKKRLPKLRQRYKA